MGTQEKEDTSLFREGRTDILLYFASQCNAIIPALPNLPFKANLRERGLHGGSQRLLEQSCYSLSVRSLVLSFGSAIRSCHLYHGLDSFSFLPPKHFKQKCHGQRWTSTEFGESQTIALMIPDSVSDIPDRQSD